MAGFFSYRKVNAKGEAYGSELTHAQMVKTFGEERLHSAVAASEDGKRFEIDGRRYEVSRKDGGDKEKTNSGEGRDWSQHPDTAA